MKENKNKKEPQNRKRKVVPPETPDMIRDNRDTGRKQYPPRVGYHGSDDEKDLSPEE